MPRRRKPRPDSIAEAIARRASPTEGPDVRRAEQETRDWLAKQQQAAKARSNPPPKAS